MEDPEEKVPRLLEGCWEEGTSGAEEGIEALYAGVGALYPGVGLEAIMGGIEAGVEIGAGVGGGALRMVEYEEVGRGM